MGRHVGIKQFRSEGCLSYALWDPAGGEAFFIDPRVERMEEYRDFIVERKLKPVIAVDTHLHADHFSATHLFKREYGTEIAMSESTTSARPTQKLTDGKKLRAGSIELEVMAAPGHSADGLILVGHGMGLGLAFTGDTLLIGSCGRVDLSGGDASALWATLQNLLKKLPGSTRILPAHDTQELVFSTLDTEKAHNPQLRVRDREEFLELKRSERAPGPAEETRARLAYNSLKEPSEECRDSASGILNSVAFGGQSFSAASINVEKYSNKLSEGAQGVLFLDVREPDEFAEGRIPGTRNLPLSDVCLELEELRKAKRIYVSCQSGRRSLWVARTLAYVGLADVVNVSGGFKAWTQAGNKVES